MRALIRWTVAVAGSLAVFAASWAVCQYLAGLESGTSLSIAGALLAVVLALLGWWAAREPAVESGLSGERIQPSTAVMVGERSQVTSGNTGIVISGDVRGATIHIDSAQRSEQPLPVPPTGATGASPEECFLVGDIPQRPLAFQPRAGLLAPLRERVGGPGICVIHAVTGMRGTGKTQAAAAYARECVAEGWRLVAWVNAHGTATAVDGLAQAAAAMKLALGEDQPASARALRHWLEAGGHQCLIMCTYCMREARGLRNSQDLWIDVSRGLNVAS
jgi:hypothetical protein